MGSLRLGVLVVMACLFWAGVALVQRPWQTLARRIACGGGVPCPAETPPAAPQTVPRADVPLEFHAPDELHTLDWLPPDSPDVDAYFDAITFGTQWACKGAVTPQERALIARQPVKRRHSRM